MTARAGSTPAIAYLPVCFKRAAQVHKPAALPVDRHALFVTLLADGLL